MVIALQELNLRKPESLISKSIEQTPPSFALVYKYIGIHYIGIIAIDTEVKLASLNRASGTGTRPKRRRAAQAAYARRIEEIQVDLRICAASLPAGGGDLRSFRFTGLDAA
jgi:hypothetical protein